MNPAKASALLNGRVQTYYQGFGGERMTETDVAFAYGMMWDEGARLYGRVKWAGQMALVEPLYRRIRTQLEGFDWKDVKDHELDRITLLAMVEGIYPHLCPVCAGHGTLMVEKRKVGRPRKRKVRPSLKVVCQGCKGEGVKPYTERALSKLSGIKRWRWANVWGVRYREDVQPIVYRMERIFWSGMRRLLA